MTEFSGGYGKYFDGNSILVQLNKKKYISIGWNIYSFETKDNIIKYSSPVGNNYVAYPYAIDNKGKHYLMIEYVIVKNVPEKEDPYWYYYDLKGKKKKEEIKELKIKRIDGRQWNTYLSPPMLEKK